MLRACDHGDRLLRLRLTASAEAAAAYVRGVELALETRAGCEELFDEAAQLDDGFALPRVQLAQICAARGDRAGSTAFREQACELAERATRRERQHVSILLDIAARRADLAARAKAHLAEFPRDAIVLEQSLRHLFFFGGAGRGIAALELLACCRDAYSTEDWFFPARHAFYLQELGRYDEAEPLATRAVELNPRNGNAMHALIHVLHGRGKHQDAGAAAAQLLGSYDGVFRSHFVWHAAIVSLDALDPGAAWSAFDDYLQPTRNSGPAHLALADAVGFLCSCAIVGLDPQGRWSMVDAAVTRFAAAPGHPFVDVHTALALVRLGARDRLDAFVARLRDAAAGPGPARWGLPIVEAIVAMADRRFVEAADRIQCLTEVEREAMGGSNVELGIIDEIMIEACAGAGQRERALAELTRRFAAGLPAHPILARLVPRDA